MKNQQLFFVKIYFVLLAMFLTSVLQARTYYFSSSLGNDARSATEAQQPATPWQTLTKLNVVVTSLLPGDSVLFKRGDVFQGSLSVTVSGQATAPIVFSAYGTGEQPVINGLTTVDNWNFTGSNIWETMLTGTDVNIVLLNGVFQAIGRYPNNDAAGGYAMDAVYQNNTSLTSNAISAANWNGAEVVIRKNRWILDRNPVTGQSGNTIAYTSSSGYGPTTGYGFFMQNHRGTLDKSGEWYYTNKKLGIYLANAASNYTVQVSTVPVLITISGRSNLVFDGLRFSGANQRAFDINNSQGVSIRNCTIVYSGINALRLLASSGCTLESCTIDYSNDVALLADNSPGLIVRNNAIRHSGSVPGMGRSGDGTYSALLLTGDNMLVEGNTIEQTGYIPISFRGSSVTIKNNFITDFTLVKDDGGGIYTWNNIANAPVNTAQKITGNILLGGHSANEGTTGTEKKTSHGIYLDDNTANVEVTGNTVAACEGFGLYIHNARSNNIRQNTAFNNTVQLEMVHDDIAPNSPINTTELSNNIFVSLQPMQLVAEFKSNGDDLAQFGTFANNRYSRPFDDNAVIGVLKKAGGNYSYLQTDVEGWQALYGLDAGSGRSPKTFLPYVITSYSNSNKFSNGNFTANSGGLYAYSPANNCQTSWVPNGLDGGTLGVGFSSITGNSKGTIVIGVGQVSAGKKYLLRFSLRGGAEQKMLDVYLRKSGAPYNDITGRRAVKITASRKEVELLFTATESTTDGSIGIDVPEQESTVYFDNVNLQEVTATDVAYADSVKFIYNATGSAVTTTLAGGWVDANATPYKGSIALSPWTSVVLLAGGNAVAPPAEGTCSATGTILREKWLNTGGNDVANIPLNTMPSLSDQLTSLEESPNQGDNYGSRIRGYLCPPQTGDYTFWIAGDDGTELWLSDSSNIAAKTKIAYSLSWTGFREWNRFASQKSVLVHLEAGRKYYIEALHKEGAGGDHLSVAWQLPDGSTEAPIGGNRLSPFVPSVAVIQQCTATGTILREQWDGVDGNDVAQIPVWATPSSTTVLTSFEGPQNTADRYGSRISGYLCPPQSGLYTFWIAGDDGTELWLSKDNLALNKTKIAYSLSWTGFREWTRFASQKSAQVYLEVGKKYYVEALQKDGAGGDHLSVSWQLPDGTMEAPIAGSHLSPATAVNTTIANKSNAIMQNTAAENTLVPETIKFINAYPNPFSGRTTVILTPAETGTASVAIYDGQGRLMQKLYNGTLNKNKTQQFVFNSKLKAGVYYVRCMVNGRSVGYTLICQ